MKAFKRVCQRKKMTRGASLMEYGLIVGLVAIVGIVGVRAVGDDVSSVFSDASDILSAKIDNGASGASPQQEASDVNQAPKLARIESRDGVRVVASALPAGEVLARYTISDDDGDALSVDITGSEFNVSQSGSQVVVTLSQDLPPGQYAFDVSVSDGQESVSSQGSLDIRSFVGLVNGSFDNTQNSQSAPFGRVSSDPAGWTLVSGSAFEYTTGAVSSSRPQAHSGTYALDTVSQTGGVSAEQTLQVDPYTPYTLKFFVANQELTPDLNFVDVYWQETRVARISPDLRQAWFEQRVVLPETNETQGTLRFEGVASDGSREGILVDSMSVTQGDTSFDESSPARTNVALGNGSFEQAMNFWTQKFPTSRVFPTPENGYVPAAHGAYYFDGIYLEGDYEVLSQSVAVRPGHTYRISYWYAPRRLGEVREMEVFWEGIEIDTISTAGVTQFQERSFEVVANSTGELKFSQLPASGTSSGVGLDNISIVDITP